MFSVAPVAVGSVCNASAKLGCSLLYLCVDFFLKNELPVLHLHLKHFTAALINTSSASNDWIWCKKVFSSEHLVMRCSFICLPKWYCLFAACFMRMNWTQAQLSVTFCSRFSHPSQSVTVISAISVISDRIFLLLYILMWVFFF